MKFKVIVYDIFYFIFKRTKMERNHCPRAGPTRFSRTWPVLPYFRPDPHVTHGKFVLLLINLHSV